MKKLITSIIIALTAINAFSFESIKSEVVLYLYGKPIKTDPTVKPHSVASYPRVVSENGVITITSGRLIENARITITDNNGSVIACEVVDLDRTGVSIQVPIITEGDTYKIEIEYGDTYLYGIIGTESDFIH